MKHTINLFLLLLLSSSLFAQVELPQRSPKASVSYRVGLTDVNIEYSAPAVRKRAIFGALVPYDQVWRTGANKCTNITFGTDVKIGDVPISRGRYAFFIIPKNGTTWTAIFNSDFDQWGAYDYKEDKDVARIDIKIEGLVKPVERLQFSIDERGIDQGAIVLEWERKRIVVPFSMETMKMAMANIEKGLATAPEDKKWGIHGNAAEFLLNNNGDMAMALSHAAESVKAKPIVWNLWLNAQALAKTGDYKGAVAMSEKVAEASKANKDETDYYKELEKEITTAVTEWKRHK